MKWGLAILVSAVIGAHGNFRQNSGHADAWLDNYNDLDSLLNEDRPDLKHGHGGADRSRFMGLLRDRQPADRPHNFGSKAHGDYPRRPAADYQRPPADHPRPPAGSKDRPPLGHKDQPVHGFDGRLPVGFEGRPLPGFEGMPPGYEDFPPIPHGYEDFPPIPPFAIPPFFGQMMPPPFLGHPNFPRPDAGNLHEGIPKDLNDANSGFRHPGMRKPAKAVVPVDEERPKRPSQSAHAGHLPEDIIRLREMYKRVQEKYFGNMFNNKQEHSRQGRLLGMKQPFNYLLASNPLTAWMVEHPLNQMVVEAEKTKLGMVDQIMAPFNHLLLGKTASVHDAMLDTPKTQDLILETTGSLYNDIKMAGIETCSNGDGVCEDYQYCVANGGTPIGSCYNCQECSTCCKYVYDDESNTCNSAILFFQSEDYPLTRDDTYSSSLTIKIRDDVCQVLIEFVDFEFPIGKHGCFDDAYLEVINPMTPEGVLGDGNSRFCGINTDQHVYLPVRGGDLLILKVATSGKGYYDDHHDDKDDKDKDYHKDYSDDFRFKLKITQIIDKASFKTVAVTGGNLLVTAFQSNPVLKSFLRKNDLLAEAFPFAVQKLPTKDVVVLYANIRAEVPEYYQKLLAPDGCLQYFHDSTGIIESFNYDGKSSMPKNLDYSICFKHHKHCGMSLSALKFDIPACRKECMDGTKAIADGYPCCTAGLDGHKDDHKDDHGDGSHLEKWFGVDGTSDGHSKHKENQKRYFFCGTKLGHTNYVESDRQGPLRVQVYSDDKWYDDYKSNGVGFRIKYEVIDC